jgi:hypothetical protein
MRVLLSGTLGLALLLAGCKPRADHSPSIGLAYAGPATLVLRQDISPSSPPAVTVHHGDPLDIVQQRRRFIKVRTVKGQEGWIEDRLVLTPDEFARLKRFNQNALVMPSQGVATTYDILNIHTEPSRYSPSFIQVKQGEKFDVIAHEAAPRKAPPRKALVLPAPKRVAPKKPEKPPKIPPPPAPAAPKPPEDWIELSKTNLPEEAVKQVKEAEPMDDWSLIRTSGGQSGWVLTRRLFMAIPDEVAQYAEGRRITSYFPLGEIRDGDQVKKIWLWTTIEETLQPHDYDSYRVFVWSLRHHRYETAYIQRRVRGYFPVLTEAPGFSVCVENRDGERRRRIYSVVGVAIRPAGEKVCEAPATLQKAIDSNSALALTNATGPPAASESLFTRIKNRLRDLRKRLFNR